MGDFWDGGWDGIGVKGMGGERRGIREEGLEIWKSAVLFVYVIGLYDWLELAKLSLAEEIRVTLF